MGARATRFFRLRAIEASDAPGHAFEWKNAGEGYDRHGAAFAAPEKEPAP
jgi:hypothetical protein